MTEHEKGTMNCLFNKKLCVKEQSVFEAKVRVTAKVKLKISGNKKQTNKRTKRNRCPYLDNGQMVVNYRYSSPLCLQHQVAE